MAFAEAAAKGKAAGTTLGARDTWVVAWARYEMSQRVIIIADALCGPSPCTGTGWT